MDTYNDDENSDYGSEEAAGHKGFGDLADDDRLSVNMDDIVDEESDEETIDLGKSDAANGDNKLAASTSDAEEAKTEAVNTTSGSNDSGENNKSTGGSSGSGGNASTGNLFAVGESTDKGLADMETGSEVYMSELLVSDIYNVVELILIYLYCRLASTWRTLTKRKRRMKKT